MTEKKKSLLSKLIEKVDTTLKKKADSNSSCCRPGKGNKDKNSCCG